MIANKTWQRSIAVENDEQKNEGLSKEEILARSRAENKHGDEREQQSLYKAAYTATAVGFILYGIIAIVLAVLGKHSYEMTIVMFGIMGTMYTVWGVKTTKRRALFLSAGIVAISASVVAAVCWILEICGVM